MRTLKNPLFLIFVALLLALFLLPLKVSLFRVEGRSMEPTLRKGEVVVALRDAPIGPSSLVVFFDPRGGEERKLVKRVAARDGDPLLRTPEGSLLPAGSLYEQGTPDLLRVPQGCLFVEGDNPGFSDDSRRGWLVPRPLVVGTVKAVLFPLSRFRLIP